MRGAFGAAVAGALVFVLTMLVALLPAGVLVGTSACTPGELATAKTDLQTFANDDAKLEGAFCAPIEAATAATPVGPYVDGICVLAGSLGQVAGAVAQDIPSAKVIADADPPDAGPLVLTSPFAVHVSVRRDIATQWFAAHSMPAGLRALITDTPDGGGGGG